MSEVSEKDDEQDEIQPGQEQENKQDKPGLGNDILKDGKIDPLLQAQHLMQTLRNRSQWRKKKIKTTDDHVVVVNRQSVGRIDPQVLSKYGLRRSHEYDTPPQAGAIHVSSIGAPEEVDVDSSEGMVQTRLSSIGAPQEVDVNSSEGMEQTREEVLERQNIPMVSSDVQAQATPVSDEDIMREAQENLIAHSVQAEAVNLDLLNRRKRRNGAILLICVVIIIIVLSVSIATTQTRDEVTPVRPDVTSIQASLEANDPSTLNYFSANRYVSPVVLICTILSTKLFPALSLCHIYQTIVSNGKQETITEGLMITFQCVLIDCVTHEETDHCDATKFYEPGCCFGSDCSPETKCGYGCPQDPFPCWSKRDDCRSISCMECETGADGEPFYTLQSFQATIDCLATGTKIAQDNTTYKWAVYCGQVETGGSVESNLGVGEYICGAFRDGPGFNITRSWLQPCQWLQVTECGCAPVDVYSFGVDPPDLEVGWTPCLTEADCPFLCADAGPEKVKNLCHAFNGIDWWEDNGLFDVSGENFNESVTKITLY